jgi:DNA-directed RNA polymerase specialized sigma24 family protein
MSDAVEVVEGQAVARLVLDALDRGETPDWNAVQLPYGEPLLRQAAARIRRRDLGRHFSAEDLLNDFLACRVYPPRRARALFGPSARGERPLRPRLLTSLANHCADMARAAGAGRAWGECEDRLANSAAPATPTLPAFEEVAELLRRRMAAIRKACPLRRRPHGAAYREALLLRLRLDLAGGFDGVELHASTDGRTVVLDLALLEELTAWTAEEGAMPLVEGGAPLDQLWRQVRAVVVADRNRQVTVDQLAQLIPTSRDGWNQWVSRGRRRLKSLLGSEYGELFALWSD